MTYYMIMTQAVYRTDYYYMKYYGELPRNRTGGEVPKNPYAAWRSEEDLQRWMHENWTPAERDGNSIHKFEFDSDEEMLRLTGAGSIQPL